MIQFLPWIIDALIGASVTLLVIDILRWPAVVDWFQRRTYLTQADCANVGFTLMQHQQSGNYKTVQGVFNKRSNQVLEARQVESRQIDPQIANAHAGKDVIFYP